MSKRLYTKNKSIVKGRAREIHIADGSIVYSKEFGNSNVAAAQSEGWGDYWDIVSPSDLIKKPKSPTVGVQGEPASILQKVYQ